MSGGTGFQPRNTPAERRAFFDQQRKLGDLVQRLTGTEGQIAAIVEEIDLIQDEFGLYLPLTGGTMTGELSLPGLRVLGDTQPIVRFMSEDGLTQRSYLGHWVAGNALQLVAGPGNAARVTGPDGVLLNTGGVDRFVVHAGGIMEMLQDVRIAGGTLRVVPVTAAQSILVGGNGAGGYVAFFPDASSVGSLGTRASYVGHVAASGGNLNIVSELGGLAINSAGGTLDIRTGSVSPMLFRNGTTEQMRLSTSLLLMQKTATNIGVAGLELGAERLWVTRGDASSSFSTNKIGVGAGAAAGSYHAAFYTSGALRGSITATGTNGAGPTAYNTTSDKNLKEDLGEIDPEVAAYVMRLIRPHWFRWLADGPSGHIISGYLAQQVAELWPGAIDHGVVTPGTGTPEDAEAWQPYDDDRNRRCRLHQRVCGRNERVAEESAWSEPDIPEFVPNPLVPWQMDMSKLLPVIHAAWLFTDQRQSDHELRLRALEGEKR